MALSFKMVMLPLFPGIGAGGVEDELHAYMRRKHRTSAVKKKTDF